MRHTEDVLTVPHGHVFPPLRQIVSQGGVTVKERYQMRAEQSRVRGGLIVW